MNTTIFVGLDVHKATVSVAVAEGQRGGEVRCLGTFPNRADQIARLVERLAKGRSLVRSNSAQQPEGCKAVITTPKAGSGAR